MSGKGLGDVNRPILRCAMMMRVINKVVDVDIVEHELQVYIAEYHRCFVT